MVDIAGVVIVDDALSSSALDAKIMEIQESYPGAPLFLLFTGEKLNGRSWCPDCTRAEPIILGALEEYCSDSVLVVFNVKREEFRSPDYCYRSNPLINLRCVPTLHRWKDGTSAESLNDSQCQDKTLVCKTVSNAKA